MAQISLAQARAEYTNQLQAVYRERIMPTAFLRSFFVPKESQTKLISIVVRRGRELAAVDVQRGTEGNRNSFSKSSEKTFEPPFFNEFLEATEMDFYDRMWNATGSIEVTTFKMWLDELIENLDEVIFKIDRAYEIMCSQIFETGIVSINAGTNIDFKRKAASLVANAAGNTWATGTVSPYETMEAGCTFIRTKGKSQGTVYNCIMGTTAFSDFMLNTIVKERNDLQHISLDSIKAPQRVSDATLHGQVTAGSYTVRIWTYNEFYDTASTSNNEYINPKKIIILPEAPKFNMMYAGVQKLLGDNGPKEGAGLTGQKGRYHISEYLDVQHSSHKVIVKSAGVPVPVAVDQIYTVQVVV